MEAVYLLIGSNSGKRHDFLRFAVDRINTVAGDIVFRSHIYESAPWGFESQHEFLNQVVLINTPLEPEDLLDKLMEAESMAGRRRSANAGYEDRTLDIDILFYGSRVIDSPRLTVPHPRLHLRRFTLAPLCEIAPYFIHPVFRKTVSELLERCDDQIEVKQIR